MELLFVVDTTRLLVAAPLFLNKQSVASQPASQPTPRKQRFGQAEKQRAGAAFGRTLASGLRLKDRLGETRSQKELKINFINKGNYSGNKRSREQPIAEEDGDWHYAEEEENCPGIDAQADEVGSGQMDEDQDVYAHSA